MPKINHFAPDLNLFAKSAPPSLPTIPGADACTQAPMLAQNSIQSSYLPRPVPVPDPHCSWLCVFMLTVPGIGHAAFLICETHEIHTAARAVAQRAHVGVDWSDIPY